SSDTTVIKGQSIDASIDAPSGPHTLKVKAWGPGTVCVQDVAINVSPGGSGGSIGPGSGATTASVGSGSLTVTSPSSGESVTSPFHLSAFATTCKSQNVAAMGYSFDSSSNTTVIKGQSIDASIDTSSGQHTLKVKAWGPGVACVQDVNIDVGSGSAGTTASSPTASSGGTSGASGSGSSVIPSHAISVSNLDVMSGWTAKHDSAGPGSSSGSTQVVSSPSVSGSSREFLTSFSNSGDVRYSLSFADDTSVDNFFYDTWVYVNSSASSIGNLEFDINQTMSDGKTVMFGIICDGYTDTWSYTVNTGSVSSPRPRHIGKSGTHCNPRAWTQNTWHHLQAYYSHDSSGYITYHAVWFDGVESQLNETVLGSDALGWGPVINTQFQVDGLGSNHNTVYLGNLNVYRW
ncbi:MAG TPA: hypothetical protein VGR47_16950, partial [Terracidiphilus sp.]|nr:hypothetical protein [Terracidiphilus sp.]